VSVMIPCPGKVGDDLRRPKHNIYYMQSYIGLKNQTTATKDEHICSVETYLCELYGYQEVIRS